MKALGAHRYEIERCQAVLEEVKEQERKLLHMHYEDRISGELFDDEQARIRERRKDAETLIVRLGVRHEDIAATLDLAPEILSDDLHQFYRRAEDSIRRPINQAIFKALYVCDEAITEAELAEPFAALRTLHDAIRAPAQQRWNPGRTLPALPRQGERSRPLSWLGTFPRWFD